MMPSPLVTHDLSLDWEGSTRCKRAAGNGRRKRTQEDARAFWIEEVAGGHPAGCAAGAGPDDIVVEALFSGISRGTETLVFRHGVPPSQYAAMRCPFQEGDFPAPVKYGYSVVGRVVAGPPELRHILVFVLHPHQTRFVVPAKAVVPVPEDVPAVALCWRRTWKRRSTASGTPG